MARSALVRHSLVAITVGSIDSDTAEGTCDLKNGAGFVNSTKDLAETVMPVGLTAERIAVAGVARGRRGIACDTGHCAGEPVLV